MNTTARTTEPLSAFFAPRSVSFQVLSGPSDLGESFLVERSQFAIGRTRGDVVLEHDPLMEDEHASLAWVDGDLVLRDLESTNGTYVRLLEPTALVGGDMIRLGSQAFVFEVMEPLHPTEVGGARYLGSSEQPGSFRLVQILDGGREGMAIVDRNDDVTLGAAGAIVEFPEDRYLSALHVRIYRSSDGRYLLDDLGSVNGTWLRLREPWNLQEGDQIMVGSSILHVRLA